MQLVRARALMRVFFELIGYHGQVSACASLKRLLAKFLLENQV
jgi:hypothetical protein